MLEPLNRRYPEFSEYHKFQLFWSYSKTGAGKAQRRASEEAIGEEAAPKGFGLSPSCEDFGFGGEESVVMADRKGFWANSEEKWRAQTRNPSPFGHTPRWSMMSGSPGSARLAGQLSFPDHPLPSPDASPLQSPSRRSGDLPPGYDPKRIPFSIFSRKSGVGENWSGASNESLFSIHVDNGSFTNVRELSERKSLSVALSPLAAAADCDAKDVKMFDVSQVKGLVETPKPPSSGNATPSSQALSPSPTNSNAPQIATFQSPRMSTGSVNSCQSFAFLCKFPSICFNQFRK
nr:circumsporozoite protein-like [Ipomoea batatas]